MKVELKQRVIWNPPDDRYPDYARRVAIVEEVTIQETDENDGYVYIKFENGTVFMVNTSHLIVINESAFQGESYDKRKEFAEFQKQIGTRFSTSSTG